MILSRERRYLSAAFLFFVSGAIPADVPYVFQEGDTIRADEINENFRHLDTEVGTLSDDVESGANTASPDEDYTYSQKNLTVGRDKLTVLGRTYDIVEIDTLSFKDHDLFSIKFPAKPDYENRLNAKSLDIVNFSYYDAMPRARERRYDDKVSYSDRISGYPATISVYVRQYHQVATPNYDDLRESEYDTLEWEKHEFYWSTDDDGVYNQLRLYITATNPNPSSASEYYQNYTIRCEGLDQAQGDFPRSFSWNATTNQTYRGTYTYGNENDLVTDIPDVNSSLSTAIASCIAEAKAEKQYEWRKNVYNTLLEISISASLLLDDSTITEFSFSFDSADYEADLRRACEWYSTDTEDEFSCGAEFTPLQRDFSALIDQQGTLARKPRREEFVQELFTLLDHIVISETEGN
jgi:hypothetical protein